jgi:hypothetical protein
MGVPELVKVTTWNVDHRHQTATNDVEGLIALCCQELRIQGSLVVLQGRLQPMLSILCDLTCPDRSWQGRDLLG